MFDDQTQRFLLAHRTIEFGRKIKHRKTRLLIADQRRHKRRITAEATPSQTETKDTANLADLILKGRLYFEGNTAFKNRGASCISCHNVNYKDMIAGGVLAKDLTNCYARLGGDAGISGLLCSPPFPAMTQAFKNNPLTQDEIKALSAFLQDVDNPQAPQTAGMNPLLIGGLIGFMILFGLILLVWNKRKIRSVKSDYHGRQIKTIN